MKNWYKLSQAEGGAPPAPPPPPPPPPPMSMPPPAAGAAPGGPSEQRVGTMRGARHNLINDIKSDDKIQLNDLNRVFKNAVDAGHNIEDAAAMSIMANGSTIAPQQLDIAEAYDSEFPDNDPPFIRRIIGLDLGVPLAKPETPA